MSDVNLTEIVRAVPEVVEMRKRLLSNAIVVSGQKLAAAFESWAKGWKSNFREQEWDSNFHVCLEDDMLAGLRMTGSRSIKYFSPDGDCNHFAVSAKGMFDTAFRDPENKFGPAAAIGLVGDFVAHHSFLMPVVHDGAGNLKVILVEPQSDGEVQPSEDPKNLYDVAGYGVVFFN